jgi:hypothetical protein
MDRQMDKQTDKHTQAHTGGLWIDDQKSDKLDPVPLTFTVPLIMLLE